MIVADSNIVVYLVFSTTDTGIAEEVWRRDREWVVPSLFFSEVMSAFGIAHRRRLCTFDEAAAAIERAAGVVIGSSRPVSARTVLELSRDSGCTTYDCEYVALAIALGVPLVTADRAVLRAFPTIAIAPKDFAARAP